MSDKSYIRFWFTFDKQLHGGANIIELGPPLSVYLKWSAILATVFILVPPLYRRFFPETYERMGPAKRSELASSTFCFVHHIYVSLMSGYHIWDNYRLFRLGIPVTDAIIRDRLMLTPCTVAYFSVDLLLYVIPEFFHGRGSIPYLIHHFITLSLFVCALFLPMYIYLYLPSLLFTEVSNLFFNAAWHLRVWGLRDAPVTKYMELSFVVSYFFTRVINLPLALAGAVYSLGDGYLHAKAIVVVILGLQFFWFYKLLVATFARLKPKPQSQATTNSNASALKKQQ